MTQFPAAPDRPWSGLGPVWVAFYPWVIALGFMVPQEVTFSLWFFFWAARAAGSGRDDDGAAQPAAATRPGRPAVPHSTRMTGAFLMMGRMLLWRARRDIVGAWDGTPPAARTAAPSVWLAGSGAGCCSGPPRRASHCRWPERSWRSTASSPSSWGGSRPKAAGPSPFRRSRPTRRSALMQNMHGFSQPALVTFGWWQNLGVQVTDDLMPHQITGARLAEEVGAEPLAAPGAGGREPWRVS